MIHRDVKPENMLLGRHNEVLLSDFGIVTVAHSNSSMYIETSMGTVPYMAPEQIQEHPRPASDQYSLAVVVYQWLTGELPFQGSTTEVIVKHISVPPPPLRSRVPTLSPEVEQVVLIALNKEPKARFASIQAFANALEQAAQQSSRLEPTIATSPAGASNSTPTIAAASPMDANPTVMELLEEQKKTYTAVVSTVTADVPSAPPTPELAPTVLAHGPADSTQDAYHQHAISDPAATVVAEQQLQPPL